MSRMTRLAVRKRIATALWYHRSLDRALRGGDDGAAQILRRNFSAAGYDLSNPDHVERVIAEIDGELADIFSNPAEWPVFRNPGQTEEQKARKAQAKAACRAKLEAEKCERTYTAALATTARWARDEWPEIFEGQSDEQCRRIWSRR
jgi:hypothetical protein